MINVNKYTSNYKNYSLKLAGDRVNNHFLKLVTTWKNNSNKMTSSRIRANDLPMSNSGSSSNSYNKILDTLHSLFYVINQ